jgi:Ras-related protein Rab-23
MFFIIKHQYNSEVNIYEIYFYNGGMSEEEVKLKKKVVLLGDGAVGKTSLIRRFVFDKFDDKYITTIGTKVSKKDIVKPLPDLGIRIKLTLMVWDILGQRGINQLHNMYYQNAKAALMVCDITRKTSLENLRSWRADLFNVTGEIPALILMNKIDLLKQAEINVDDVENLVKDWDIDCYLTSAKSGRNVEVVFNKIGTLLMKSEIIELQNK